MFTAELAENAEKKALNNLCVLSDLSGEIHLGLNSGRFNQMGKMIGTIRIKLKQGEEETNGR